MTDLGRAVPDPADTSRGPGGRWRPEGAEMFLEAQHGVLRRSQRGRALLLRGPHLLVQGAEHVAHGSREIGGDGRVGHAGRRPGQRSELVLERHHAGPRHRPTPATTLTDSANRDGARSRARPSDSVRAAAMAAAQSRRADRRRAASRNHTTPATIAANSRSHGQTGESSSDEVGSAAGVVAAAEAEVDDGAGVLDVGSSVDGVAVVGFALVGFALVGLALVGFALVGFALVGAALVGGAVVGAALVGGGVVGSAEVGSAVVVGASVGVSLALRLGPVGSVLVAEGSERLGVAVRLGRAPPEPPPQPVATASVSAASATMTGFAFFTGAPSSVWGQSLRVWRGTRTRASHAADEWPAHERSRR